MTNLNLFESDAIGGNTIISKELDSETDEENPAHTSSLVIAAGNYLLFQ